MLNCAEDLEHSGKPVGDWEVRSFIALTTLRNVSERALKRPKLAGKANTLVAPDRLGRDAEFLANSSDIHALLQGQSAASGAQLAPPSLLMSTAWARVSGFKVTA